MFDINIWRGWLNLLYMTNTKANKQNWAQTLKDSAFLWQGSMRSSATILIEIAKH